MRVAVPMDTLRDRRAALVPESVQRLVRSGFAVTVQAGAGLGAGLSDDAYRGAGAALATDLEGALRGAAIILRVGRPPPEERARYASGQVLIGMLQPARDPTFFAELAQSGVTALAMELVPRLTRAQAMDALSSQATVAGYKAVLVGAAALGKLMPMLTTAAGTLAPARVFVVGAGVAGLQAIATARRLGAVVSAFDVRAVAREQVQSLGATFLEAGQVKAEGQGGYARALDEAEQRAVEAVIARHVGEMDLVITTAQVPGRPAPRILSAEAVRSMRPGSVIVDLAAESGGNTALTRAGETIEVGGVTILGPLDLAATVPLHASQMYARNLEALLGALVKDGALHLDLADELLGPMIVTHAGEVRRGGAS